MQKENPMKIIISAIALSLTAPLAMAQATEQAAPAANAAAGETVTVNVNGLVCDFCAQSVKKVFKKRDAVETVDVDLDNGKVVVTMKPGQTLDDATVTELIRKSGYAVTGIDRTGA